MKSSFWSGRRALALVCTFALAGTAFSEVSLPASFPGHWSPVGRVTPQVGPDSVTLQDGFLADGGAWGDCEFSFRARAPLGTEQVQIWAAARMRDRDSRYVFALRGGNNDDVYLARYGSEGGDRFLGIAPLDFHPVPGTWYTLRLRVKESRFQIFVNDEKLPRINVLDPDAPWSGGGIALGGGWLPVEFRDVAVHALAEKEAASFDALGTQVWRPPAVDKERLRAAQRAAYRPLDVPSATLPATRGEVSLDGKWLFFPDQDLASGADPSATAFDDRKWHVMDVPQFWTPSTAWLYSGNSFEKLDELSATSGESDNIYKEEFRRLDGYTFDWRKTRAAWYRQYLDLPADPAALAGRRFDLSFGAIAKISDVWVNGVKVGSHTGMFGEVDCDATAALKPGRNVVAVHVLGQPVSKPKKDQVLGVAVTVEVTDSMLHSLPHGMMRDDVSGIWQPARLVVTRPVAIDDLYLQPRLDGLAFDMTVRNGAVQAQAGKLAATYTIVSAQDGSVLASGAWEAPAPVAPGATQVFRLATPRLAPKLWSPQDPNLYRLQVHLTADGRPVDDREVPFGFRTIEVKGGKIVLNGAPLWLRGANHFPNILRPNDAALARRFITLARDGNVLMTRSHGVPFTDTWLDAADELGMGVSCEGTWPWLMLKGEPPDAALLKIWQDEFSSMIRKYRNHPSILLWTINNEMKFPGPGFDKDNPELLAKKWPILSGMVKAVRAIDPTRPIVCDSSYFRKWIGDEYEKLVKPNGFDDGDIDDRHAYYGWYEPTFFHFFHHELAKEAYTPGRPLISQEMSTGYSRNDDGHPARSYLFKNHTPQCLVGNEAYENRDPAIFLKRQAFMTKELAEAFRRGDRDDLCGILYFAYTTWFQDAWKESIKPFPAYYGLRKALQPVLVSAELYGRHFYAGDTARFRVCVANDSSTGAAVPPSRVVWQLRSGEQVLAEGSAPLPSLPYYKNQWVEAALPLPAALPSPRLDASLVLRLESKADGTVLSQNDYDVTVATRAWANEGLAAAGIALFDPSGKFAALRPGGNVAALGSLAAIPEGRILVVAGADAVLADPVAADRVKQFVEGGGKALLLDAGAALPKLFPDQIQSYRTCPGEIVSLRIPESPAFDGLDPLDLAWFQPEAGQLIPRACRGTWHPDVTRTDIAVLADLCDLHGYIKASEILKIGGTPLVRFPAGKGTVIASEMLFQAAPRDPVAGRLFANLFRAF